MSEVVKDTALFLARAWWASPKSTVVGSSSRAGIATVTRRFDLDSRMPPGIKYAIVMAIETNYEFVRHAPTAKASAAAGLGYSKMSFLTPSMAKFVAMLGYKAIACGNDTALSIPLAIDAGLGQLGRLGTLITPEFGPRVRLCKVLTDLPLVPTPPIDFGVTEFCNKCEKCAQYCPGAGHSSMARARRTPAPLRPTPDC